MDKSSFLSKLNKVGSAAAVASVAAEFWQVGAALCGSSSVLSTHFALVLAVPAAFWVMNEAMRDGDSCSSCHDYDDDDLPCSTKNEKPFTWTGLGWTAAAWMWGYTAIVGAIGYLPWSMGMFATVDAVDVQKEFAHSSKTVCTDTFGNDARVINEYKRPVLNADETPKLDEQGKPLFTGSKEVLVNQYRKPYIFKGEPQMFQVMERTVINCDAFSDQAKMRQPYRPQVSSNESKGDDGDWVLYTTVACCLLLCAGAASPR